MPNQIRQIQAGFLSIAVKYFRLVLFVGMSSRLFSAPGKGKLRIRTAQAKRYDLSKRISTGIRCTDDQAGPLPEQSTNRCIESISGQEHVITGTATN
jgi:hypothetical protein